MSEPYNYCYSCGTALIVGKRPYAYNPMTGEPNFDYTYKCPKQPWCIFFWHPVTIDEAIDDRGL